MPRKTIRDGAGKDWSVKARNEASGNYLNRFYRWNPIKNQWEIYYKTEHHWTKSFRFGHKPISFNVIDGGTDRVELYYVDTWAEAEEDE